MRQAMSMIELVFAIVIMGIAVMSLPLILTQVQNNNNFVLQQEAILAAKTKVGNILTYEWDDNSFDAMAQRSFVLDVANGSADLNRTNEQHRKGHVDAEGRRKLYDVQVLATNIATHGTNDIDMFHNQDINLIIAPGGEEAGALSYIFNLTLEPRIAYISDVATYNDSNLSFTLGNLAVGITNIKIITVQAKNTDTNTIITTLHAFTCNIGESTILPSRPYR